jgi:hypothetical protein
VKIYEPCINILNKGTLQVIKVSTVDVYSANELTNIEQPIKCSERANGIVAAVAPVFNSP